MSESCSRPSHDSARGERDQAQSCCVAGTLPVSDTGGILTLVTDRHRIYQVAGSQQATPVEVEIASSKYPAKASFKEVLPPIRLCPGVDKLQ